VIDWNLQQRSGLDLAVEFADTHPSARIILMSGLDLSDEANRSCGGRAVFLQKPFAPSVLVELLNRLLA
jgi:DNA-binding NtrC family response regulator